MKFYRLAFFLPAFWLYASCSGSEADRNELRPGDILFQDLDCGPLCDAIEAVTEGAEGRDFSHCGLVVACGDSLCVLESIGAGVCLTPLEVFWNRNPQKTPLAGRFKDLSENTLRKAVDAALARLGEPYDDRFLPDNDAWYCSELIAEAFNKAAGNMVFEPAPMTFRMASEGEFFPAWRHYFDSLDMPVPQGVPGFNPGAMSRNERLMLFQPKR